MFTLFALLRLVAVVAGAAILGLWGWRNLGIVGCLIGIPLGLILGGILGQLPLLCGLAWVSRRFKRLTDAQLVAELHDTKCLTPNLHLLELKRRGHDIWQQLPWVHSLLASSEVSRRTAGWAALTSAFPDLQDQCEGYSPTDPTETCQLRCEPLLAAYQQGANQTGSP